MHHSQDKPLGMYFRKYSITVRQTEAPNVSDHALRNHVVLIRYYLKQGCGIGDNYIGT